MVIPTVGGSTLGRAIESALAQTHPPEAVVVVGDRVDARAVPSRLRERVEFLIGERRGASAARNDGVAAARSPWVAFLDDDDEWAPTKMAEQLRDQHAAAPVALLCAATVHRGSGASVRPGPGQPLMRGDDVFDRLYGTRQFTRAGLYLPTSSVVVPRHVAATTPFDESLTVREDLWWYRQVQQAGVPFEQMLAPLVGIHASATRSRERESRESLDGWVVRLVGISRRYARNFLLGMALREAVLARDPGLVSWISTTAVRLPDGRDRG